MTFDSLIAFRFRLTVAGNAIGLALVLLCAAGCASDQTDSSAVGRTITRTATQGPVTLTISVEPENADVSRPVLITLDIDTEEGVTILDSIYGAALVEGDRPFEYRIVVSHKERIRLGEDGKVRWRYQFTVEFFLPGDYELPPATASFADARVEDDETESSEGTADAQIQTVTTETLTVHVRESQEATLTPEELRAVPRLDPVELPREWGHWLWIGPLGMVVAVVVVVLLFRRSRRRKVEAIDCIPADVWARQQLAALVAEDLIGRDMVQAFYYRISAILRGYIERRFGVHAPEMTTEEFLVSSAQDHRIDPKMADELNPFLRACDLVKYALHKPGSGESDTVLRTAEEFVERTKSNAECRMANSEEKFESEKGSDPSIRYSPFDIRHSPGEERGL